MKTKLLNRLVAVLIISMFVFGNVNAQQRVGLFGDASRYGWDKDNASPMIKDAVNPAVFTYKAWLKPGDFKFILSNADWYPTWNKGADDTKLVKRLGDADPDVKFTISTEGNYSVTIDTTLLTISIEAMTETTPINFNTMFMVGDATPNGWDIGTSTELVKSATNPNEFSYTGNLNVGDLKFPVNINWGWGQDMFMKTSDILMFLGKTPDDSKWHISEAGNYVVTMNTSTLAISIVKQVNTGLMNGVQGKTTALSSTIVGDHLNVLNRGNFKYRIYNVTGAPVLKGNSADGIISVSNLNKGIYILSIDNKSFKFIKK